MFLQGVPIYNCTHIQDPYENYSAKRNYNKACTVGMALTLKQSAKLDRNEESFSICIFPSLSFDFLDSNKDMWMD